jgi:hypothetical protein
MHIVPPQQEGSTEAERTIHDVLLRQTLPGLPPEIATEETLCRARIFQSGACAIVAIVGACLLWYATSLLAQGSGTGIVLLLVGLTTWLTASGPGLALALLALTKASAEERPIALTLAAINGSLFVLFFYIARQHSRV